MGLFKNVNTLADTRNRLYKLIADLRASCLLLEGKRHYIEMHNLVHEVASSIASKVQPFFRMPYFTELLEWPMGDILEKYHSIFLPVCYFHELPESLDCPELKYLCLNSQDNFLKVPDDFLVKMRELRVLDLGGFDCCPSPPSSLAHLTNLRALYLCKSMLEDITIVAKLTSLEILCLENSEIKELPIELAQLTRLRLLDLSYCSRLRTIPPNLISSLTSLEELDMQNCFIQWEAGGSKNQSNNASLDELRHLDHLTSLNLKVQNASILPRDLLIFGKLERYNISIDYGWKRFSPLARFYEASRILMLNSGTSTNIHLDHGIKLLLNTVEELYLAMLKGVKNVLYQLNGEGFQQLKLLDIQDNDEIQYIIDSTERVNSIFAFANIESLVLHNLSNMKNIIHGLLPVQFFTNLKVIKVKSCNRLENMFLHSIVRNLSQLVEANISHCNSITCIVVDQGGDNINEIEELKFPKLSSLTLDCLPMLVSFCCKPLPFGMKSRSYDTKYKDDSNIPLALFDRKIEFPNLESLKISSINMRKIWVDQLSTYSCFQKLKSLTIDGCGRLEYLFPSSFTRELVGLQHLKIIRCGMLKEIFELEVKDNYPSTTKAVSSKEATFPSLETLTISHMDCLKSIWNNQLAPNSFGKLAHMEISFCKMLSNIFPHYALNNLHHIEKLLITDCAALDVVFEIQGLSARDTASQDIVATQLKTLIVGRLPMLKHIWSNDPHGSINFQNLFTVEVFGCKSLNHVFPLTVAEQLMQLQVLSIKECEVENIVAKDEIVTIVPRFVFPQLTSFQFYELLKLESWYPGTHTLNCPKLRELHVYHCDKLQLFTLKSRNIEEDIPLSIQPLFLLDKVLNIEELTLSSENVTSICNGDVDFHTVGQFSSRSLRLQCFHDESDQVPWAFIERFTNLENLLLGCSSFVQISPSEQIETTIKLRNLRLEYLKKLEYLCQENNQIQSILQNLEELRIIGCHRLKNIVPPSVLFGNLNTLIVSKCSGLTNITTLSTARSLTRLRLLHIEDCEMIEEIVANEAGDTSEVAFLKLEILRLKSLPKLKCFCNGNNSFKFPLLKRIFVKECPVMETFSHETLSTPSLRAVRVAEKNDVWCWEGDVNATINRLFNEMNSRED